jgi:7-carboxy-7-deazaguanine synthase
VLVVSEIYLSVQGESTHVGRPCVFVRLAACDLRCVWCDTPYAFTGGEKRSVDDVVGEIDRLSCRLVEITGGEPLLQEEVYPLMERLLREGYTVMLETSGERPIDRVPPEVIKIVDVKCPDSGEADTFAPRNLEYLAPHDQIKFVITGRRDYEFAREFTAAHNLTARSEAVIFSPVHGKVDLPEMASWILEDGLQKVRFGSQLHKVIWGADAQGV